MCEKWSVGEIRRVLCEDVESSIVSRMRGLFHARFHDTFEAVEVLEDALFKVSHNTSVLFRHEVAYVLGQMSQPKALAVLIRLLDDTHGEHVMTRHEAGEAIAALGLCSQTAFDALHRNLRDSAVEIRETIQLSLIGLEKQKQKRLTLNAQQAANDQKEADRENDQKPADKKNDQKTTHRKNDQKTRNRENDELSHIQNKDETSEFKQPQGFFLFTIDSKKPKVEKDSLDEKFLSYDPAEGDKELEKDDKVAELTEMLWGRHTDHSITAEDRLWKRYVAMFTLRNIATDSAAEALAASLDETESALFRHEVCFVLGQLQKAVSVHKLADRLADPTEHVMVRHEAALSLGSVGADIWTPAGVEARKIAIDVL